MAMNNVAMAALLNETLPALASPTVHGTSSTIRVFILTILGIGGLVLLILICCFRCFREFHRRPQSRATMGSYSVCRENDDRTPKSQATLSSYYVSMEEHDERSQSLAARVTYSEFVGYERMFQSGSAIGRTLLVTVLLAALAALVVGIYKLLVWLVHLCGAIHVPVWLAGFWDSATALVIHAWSSVGMLVVLVVGISLALFILLYCGLWVCGFEGSHIVLGSFAAMWMSSIGNVVAGSLYSLLQMIAAGGISIFTVLLYIVPCVALVVGAFEIIAWLVHSGALHVPTWLVDFWNSGEIFGWWNNFVAWLQNFWDSATTWVLHAWDSFEVFGWWHSFVAWLHSLWESITHHHKWKIYT